MVMLAVPATLVLAAILAVEGRAVENRMLRTEASQGHRLTLSLDSMGKSKSIQTAAEIPKIIHHTWKDYMPAGGFDKVYFNASYFSFRKFFPMPEYTFMFHIDKDLDKCIEEEFPQFLQEFRSLGEDGKSTKVEKADAGRYCILWKYGGIYADLDYEATRNFYDQLPAGKVSLNGSPYKENENALVQVQNALMASPRHHPFWPRVFERMSMTGEHTWNSTTGTGPL